MRPDDSPNAPASIAASTSADHRRELVGGRRARVGAQDRPRGSCRARPGTRRSARAAVGDDVEVLPERRASRRRRWSGRSDEVDERRVRRRSRARAMSPQLPDSWVVKPWCRWLASAPSTRTRAVRVPVRIDEPGRDDTARARRGPARPRPSVDGGQIADGQDPVAADTPTSAGRPGRPGAIDDACRRGAAGRSDRPSGTIGATFGPLVDSAFRGAIAQLEEHLHGMQGVRGSSPRSSTNRDETADPLTPRRRGGGCPVSEDDRDRYSEHQHERLDRDSRPDRALRPGRHRAALAGALGRARAVSDRPLRRRRVASSTC